MSLATFQPLYTHCFLADQNSKIGHKYLKSGAFRYCAGNALVLSSMVNRISYSLMVLPYPREAKGKAVQIRCSPRYCKAERNAKQATGTSGKAAKRDEAKPGDLPSR